MKVIKFFGSILKERDWLETMAERGWLLTNMHLGVIYCFEQIKPGQKVYEIERFGVSLNPTKQELNARKTALDIAKQAGWQVVTHDEDMNYYFVKDKAFDESDEFYDDELIRKERAEKYRRRYSQEQPMELLLCTLVISIIYLLVFFIEKSSGEFTLGLWISYFTVLIISIGIVMFYICWGQKMYDELCLSREQWEKEKAFSEKNRFYHLQEMIEYLNEKSHNGSKLIAYKDKKFLFEEDTTVYKYFGDTKSALKKRMKQQGERFRNESKDWEFQSPKWYELSIEEAKRAGLELVCIVDREILIYRREWSDGDETAGLFTEGNEAIGIVQKIKNSGWVWILIFLIGIVAGFISAFVEDIF